MPTMPQPHKPASLECETHRDKRQENAATKERQAKRMFATNSKEWRSIRRAQLNRSPLCEHHQNKGQLVSANVVDHIDGDSWNNKQSNLMSLCASCHSSKTARHDGGFGNTVTNATTKVTHETVKVANDTVGAGKISTNQALRIRAPSHFFTSAELRNGQT